MSGRLILQARKDWQRITSSGGFEEDITFKTPDSVSPPSEVIIQGLAIKHNLDVDTDGNAVSSKNAHITVSEALLVAASYPVRNASNEVSLIDHKIKYADSSGNGLQEYVILQVFADETVGIITCILGDFIEDPAIVFDPLTDPDMVGGIYYNATKSIVGTDNIYGVIDGGGFASNLKNALGNSSFDSIQLVTNQQPLLLNGAIQCDGINDELVSSSLPAFVISNSEYTLIHVFEIKNDTQTQIDFNIIKVGQNTNRIIPFYTGSSKLYSFRSEDSTGFSDLIFTTQLVTGQRIESRVNYKASSEMFINNGLAIITPNPLRKNPVGLEKVIIGNIGTGLFATKTILRGVLLFNKIITDSAKLTLIQDFLTSDM